MIKAQTFTHQYTIVTYLYIIYMLVDFYQICFRERSFYTKCFSCCVHFYKCVHFKLNFKLDYKTLIKHILSSCSNLKFLEIHWITDAKLFGNFFCLNIYNISLFLIFGKSKGKWYWSKGVYSVNMYQIIYH